MAELNAIMFKSKLVGRGHPVLTNDKQRILEPHKLGRTVTGMLVILCLGKVFFSFTRLDLLSMCKGRLLLRSVFTIRVRRIC